MGLFNNLMDVFFEEVPGPPPGGAGKQTGAPAGSGRPQRPSQMLKGGGQSTAQGGQQPAAAAPSTVRTAAPSGSVDDKVYREFSESLKRELEAQNLPGFDFYEFQQLYTRFRSEGQSEDTALGTALASAETMRVDRNTLIAKYTHYVKVLEAQKSQFELELNTFFEENIKGPRDEQSNIDREVQDKTARIQKLQEEIETLKEKKGQMGINAEKAEAQTHEVRNAFQKAYSEVAAELELIVNKLK